MPEKQFEAQNQFGQTSVIRAARDGNAALLRRLLENGEKDVIDHVKRSAYHYAAEKGHVHVLRTLLSFIPAGATRKDVHGRSPLSLAAENGFEELVRILLHTDTLEQDNFGCTPLSWAAQNGHRVIVRVLVSYKPDLLLIPDGLGRLPLSLASMNGHHEVVEYLLDQDPTTADVPDAYQRSPLALAVEFNHLDVVKLLGQRQDVDICKMDIWGRTPAMLADAKIRELLTELAAARRAEVHYSNGLENGDFEYKRPYLRPSFFHHWFRRYRAAKKSSTRKS